MSSATSRPYPASPSNSISSGLSAGQLETQQPSAKATATISSVAQRPIEMTDSSTNRTSEASSKANALKADLRKPPKRSLLQPPARPKAPIAPPPAAAVIATPVNQPPEEPAASQRPGPISLPSEPMQYRAIGLLKGKYIASEEQFNRGDIAAEDGTLIDAVLLGRVTSLIKKHIDLEKEHLWVVYPRTLYKDVDEENESEEKVPALHVQIVGVWEPETLNADAAASEEDSQPLSSKEAADQCDQFSIRGEIAKYSEEDSEILVNIVQKSKSEAIKPKRPFKLLIKGSLTGRTVGYFWDLQVERQAGELILKTSKSVAVVPPKKKPKGKKGTARRRPPANSKPKGSAPTAPKPKPKPKDANSGVSPEAKLEATPETKPEAALEARPETTTKTGTEAQTAVKMTTEIATAMTPIEGQGAEA